MLSRFEKGIFHLKFSEGELAESESLSQSSNVVKNQFNIDKFSLDNFPIKSSIECSTPENKN